MMDDLSFVRGLTFVDSFFPSGGYAHSFGLEVAAQEGVIKSGHDLERYLITLLKEGNGRLDAIAVSLSNESVRLGNFHTIIKADRQLEAMKTGQQVREASRQMGRQVIEIGAERIDNPLVRHAARLVESGEMAGHHAVTLGLILGACGWPSQTAVMAYLYQSLTGWISAALRLLPIGQREGQRLIHSLLPSVSQLGREVEGLGLEEMASWTPLHEIRTMRHAHLEVRLFRS